ncbi:unnamed protein product, partial [Phaeothamnion confervicola]
FHAEGVRVIRHLQSCAARPQKHVCSGNASGKRNGGTFPWAQTTRVSAVTQRSLRVLLRRRERKEGGRQWKFSSFIAIRWDNPTPPSKSSRPSFSVVYAPPSVQTARCARWRRPK